MVASLLVAAFLGTALLISLPPLFLENIFIESLIALGIILATRCLRAGLYVVAAISPIYSGRVSRNVAMPTDALPPTWEAYLGIAILFQV